MQRLGTRKCGWEFSLCGKFLSFSLLQGSVTNRLTGTEKWVHLEEPNI